ncbi:VCBS repeat-containing protein [bacterium]|nr:VCBS repeat-containing protein [bacterium]
MNRFLLYLLILSVLVACNAAETEQESEDVSGEELAQIYCASCHSFPEPGFLNKESWEKHMLPRMGYFLGMYENDNVRAALHKPGPGGQLVNEAEVFPKAQLIDTASWRKIKNYYLQNAPEHLNAARTKSIPQELKLFEVKYPSIKRSPPGATMVQFTAKGNVFAGDVYQSKLLQFDGDLKFVQELEVSQGAVHLHHQDNFNYLTVMGSFSPKDDPLGFILKFDEKGKSKVIVKDLRRPVHASYTDLNGDGLTDIVVSEFGEWVGRLSLFEQQKDGSYRHEVLINQTGALRTYLKDMNADGRLDIISLFGQGDESIYISYNLGDMKFRHEKVLRFSPSNGSSYFDMMDVNNDGHLDIVYTAGDNADFDPILKPYHGVYVFENNGENQFEQTFFYQLNGAFGARLGDFDMDGDIDIAAISFFPDFENSPEESFVFLEQKENSKFEAHSIPEATDGRWAVMDMLDYDNDGDLDLVLGSLAFEVIPPNPIMERWMEKGIPFIVLENKTNP